MSACVRDACRYATSECSAAASEQMLLENIDHSVTSQEEEDEPRECAWLQRIIRGSV